MTSAARLHPGPLEGLGWSPEREAAFTARRGAGLVPGRVVSHGRGALRAETADGPLDVVVQRGFRRAASGPEDHPAIGDWLALEPLGDGSAALREVLPRSSAFIRRDAAEDAGAQVVATNVDTVLIVSALTRDLNLRRLERYLALSWSSGAEPIVVLNKADLCDDVPARVAEVAAIAGGARILVLSARTGFGLDELQPELTAGRTVALLGSSGVGKSTIANALLGTERQLVREVREDDQRGRHTTSARELFRLPGGALLIDTPGMRSIGLWEADEGLEVAFDDIERFAGACRFTDCAHEVEPGCAVRAAVEAGDLAPERLLSRRKLQREMRSQERRASTSASRAESRRFGRMIRDSCKQQARLRGRPDGFGG